MSSNSKAAASTSSNEETKNSSTDPDSHKITTYFPILRGEGRAKMCASKTGDSKQKEILQKLKDKETRSLRSKAESKKEPADDGSKQETLPVKEKLMGSISVTSALKTPLSQVLRKSIEMSSDSKKDQSGTEKTRSQTSKKDQSTSENEADDKPKVQKARKSMPDSDSSRALRQKSSQSSKSVVSSLRSQAKKAPDAKTTTFTPRRKTTESGDSAQSKSASTKASVSGSSSPAVPASSSPIEDADHAMSNQSSASGSKGKVKRRRHFRGGTYSLFLSKKRRKMNMKQKSFDESRDDECSLAETENSSFFDSEDGNSMMSEDMNTPSEKSLPDEELNQDSLNFAALSSEVKADSNAKEKDLEMDVGENKESVSEEKANDESEFNAQEPKHQSSPKSEKPVEANEPGSESASNFCFKKSPSESINNATNDSISAENKDASLDDGKVEEPNDIQPSEDVEKEESDKDDDSNAASVTQEKSSLYSSGQEDDNESRASMVSSGDDQDSEALDIMHDDNAERGDPNDAQSTIATCVKSRQRIKRRFTDDIVDTDVGLLSLNSSMAPSRKNPYKPDPPKDVIQTFQSVTRSEAKKLCLTKIECIYNSHQEPVKTCTCEGETYDANLGDEDEGVFCQAVDSIDDKLIGCSNPVVTPKLVRSSVKVPFTIMCEMHLWRLKHHHSCPYCGLFCSQYLDTHGDGFFDTPCVCKYLKKEDYLDLGSFMQCTNSKNKRAIHLYHEQCQSKEEGLQPFCFHCGTSTGMKRVTLEMHMASPPSFFMNQISKIPALNGEKARISFSSPAEITKKEEEVMSGISYRIKDTGRVLSSVGLTKGPESEKLDRLLQAIGQETGVLTDYSSEDFYVAATEGDVLKILNMLAQGIDPNQSFKNHENETALHTAAANGHTTIVHLLIQAGAVNDAINERIYTPLMLAVESDHKDVVFYLVKNGAGTDFKGETGMSSFHIAAKNGNLDVLKILMSSRDVDVNSQDDGGWTPIVWASEHDHYDVVKYLLMRGANPNIRDSEGNTGLHWSAFSGSVDISFLYLDFGCDINGVNERGDTPLHIAARQDSLPCVTLFLSRGADVQIKNKTNQTPAECVIDKNSDTYLSLSLNMLLKKIAGKYQHKAEKIIHKDISRGKEQIAIQVVNDVDNEPPPLDFLYVTENCETTPMNIDRTITSLQSCHCEDDCSTATCTCASISYQCWYDKEGLLLPNFNLLDPPMLFECNRACSCWSLNCRNRVLQNGMTCRLQLIRTKGKGWGVRTLKDIPKGTFICEYVGEMISDSAADKRADDSYLFDLDNRDGETYCLDARYYGNISRFINHLCEPNLVPVKVYVDHQDLNFPRIAFFSSRDIKQYEELGFDYCEKFWVIKYKYFTCDCGSPKCKYSKDTIHTTLANYYRRVREEQMEEASQQPGVQEPPVSPIDIMN